MYCCKGLIRYYPSLCRLNKADETKNIGLPVLLALAFLVKILNKMALFGMFPKSYGFEKFKSGHMIFAI